MPEALALVRQHYGSDAVILHTRAYRRGGVLGLGAKPVVEITASSGRELGRRRAGQRNQKTKTATRPVNSPLPSRVHSPSAARTVAPLEVPDEPLAGDLIRRTYAAARAEIEPARSSGTPSVAAPSVAIARPTGSSVDQSDRFAQELAAVKALVARVADQQEREAAARQAPDIPDALVDAYTTLIQQEIAEELAQRVVRQAADTQDDVDRQDAIRNALAELMPSADADAPIDERDSTGRTQRRVIALVGPTGVGKTTTVAKLAATYKLKRGQKVGVITLDTYRIAAVDQLRTYCSIIGCPLEVVGRPEELRPCLDRFEDCDVVLIDTAGRSQRDDARLDELATFMRVAQPDETHLVLASTASQRVMLEIADRFARVNPDRVIFTKLDEAVTCGTIFNVASKIAKRVSYVTTGQEVPHQIEPGDAARLARRVLGESASAAELI